MAKSKTNGRSARTPARSRAKATSGKVKALVEKTLAITSRMPPIPSAMQPALDRERCRLPCDEHVYHECLPFAVHEGGTYMMSGPLPLSKERLRSFEWSEEACQVAYGAMKAGFNLSIDELNHEEVGHAASAICRAMAPLCPLAMGYDDREGRLVIWSPWASDEDDEN